MRKKRLSGPAKQDLLQIESYFEDKNRAAGSRIIRAIRAKIEMLVKHPLTGTDLSKLVPGIRRSV